MFVLHYNGEGSGAEAVRKAGLDKDAAPAMTPQHIANLLLKRPAIREALRRKYEAGVKAVEKEQRTIVQAAAENRFTLDFVFKNLVEIIEQKVVTIKGKQRAASDFDRLKAIELGSKICQWMQPPSLLHPPAGSTGSAQAKLVQEGDRTFFMYRSEWRNDSDTPVPAAAVAAPAILPPAPAK